MAPPKQPIRFCSIPDCGKRLLARGYCSAHYRRFSLYGNPLVLKQKQLHDLTLVERWNAYVTERGPGCWEWQGSRDGNGYGRLNVNGTPELAHRLSWVIFFGPITSSDHICHRCDNPSCVRPEHLFKGDHTANMADKMAKKRHRYGVSRGEANGFSMLTEEQVREIRASVGASDKIGQCFGISGRQVRDIRTRKSWAHIP